MDQRLAAAFGFLAVGIAFGGVFKEMDVVRLQRLGRAIQVGTGLTSGGWAIYLAISPPQYDFSSIPIGIAFLLATVLTSLFAGVILVADKLGLLKPPD
jgi:hypothetical protein